MIRRVSTAQMPWNLLASNERGGQLLSADPSTRPSGPWLADPGPGLKRNESYAQVLTCSCAVLATEGHIPFRGSDPHIELNAQAQEFEHAGDSAPLISTIQAITHRSNKTKTSASRYRNLSDKHRHACDSFCRHVSRPTADRRRVRAGTMTCCSARLCWQRPDQQRRSTQVRFERSSAPLAPATSPFDRSCAPFDERLRCLMVVCPVGRVASRRGAHACLLKRCEFLSPRGDCRPLASNCGSRARSR